MNIDVVLKRFDLFRMQVYFLPRLKPNYVCFVFINICVGLGFYGLIQTHGFLIWLLASLLFGGPIAIISLFLGMLLQMSFASEKNGTIGYQIYQVTDTHFSETILGTETKTTWSSIANVYKTKNYIYILINGCRVHIIPKRSFTDENKFLSLYELIENKFNNA